MKALVQVFSDRTIKPVWFLKLYLALPVDRFTFGA
jgi:hypothetical protein